MIGPTIIPTTTAAVVQAAGSFISIDQPSSLSIIPL